MLFKILFDLADLFGPLRVFRYTSFRILAATVTGLLVTLLLYPWFIRRLRSEQIGETIRDDGPESHKAKAGTPTMGGSLILFSLVGATVLWADLSNEYVWVTLTITVAFGAIGFADDTLKLLGKGGSRGMPGKVKLLLEFLIAAAVFGYLLYGSEAAYDGTLYLPFVSTAKFKLILPKWVYLPFAMLVVVGTSQAVNLTDGLDGLAIGPVIVASGAFLILAYVSGTVFQYWDHSSGVGVLHRFDVASYLRIPQVAGVQEVAIFLGALCGAGVGFLWYNTYPASVFMGDVGALALGGALGSVAVLTKNELLMPIIGGIFVLEAVSVITQTTSYKLTGKRVFRMAPIHHHFELKGWAEPKIIVRFWIISILLALLGLASLKLR